MARALSPNMARGVNRLRASFLDPRERELYRDWVQATARAVAQLRASFGPADDDPRLAALVGELSLKGDRFRSLWARHDVRRRETEVSRMRHPEVGDLDLYRDKLTVNGTDGQLLVVYHAKPESESARSLALLWPPPQAPTTPPVTRASRVPAKSYVLSSSSDAAPSGRSMRPGGAWPPRPGAAAGSRTG